MKSLLVAVLLFVVVISLSHATGLTQNPEFVQRAAGDDTRPADWTVEAAAAKLYRVVDDDGFADHDSLRYRAEAGQTVGPVTQAIKLTPKTDYVLMAALKSDGNVKPVVRLVGPEGQIAIVVSDGTKTWKIFSTRFNSGAADRGALEIWGDAEAVKSKEATAGASAIDGVNVYVPVEVPADVTLPAAFTPPGPNVALGKPYTLQPAPNYGYATDPDDKIQLTDGVYTVGYFWTQKTTVGWQNASPVIISLDLQQVQPIAGMSYSTAAGVAGVSWPSSIMVLVSDDGQTWGNAGDLVNLATAQDGPPPAAPYSTYRFVTDQLETHGRYVKLYVDQVPYAFVDEIEIYRGPDALLQTPYAATMEGDPQKLFEQKRIHSAILWRLRTDLASAREAIGQSRLKADEKQALLAQADALAAEIEKLPEEAPPGFKTILPLNDLHARIYALHAPLHKASGLGFLTAWQGNRWDPLEATQGPAKKPAALPQLRVQMMRHEYRGEAFNLTNASPANMTLDLKITGLAGGDNPAWISVREVFFTDTRERRPIAAALPPARKIDGAYRLTVPSGMTRQVWLEVDSSDLQPGKISGKVVVSGSRMAGQITMPLSVQVYPLTFPDQPSIHIGGWDYTMGGGTYDALPGNIPALIRMMRDNYVDTPWATSSVAPQGGKYDADGNLTEDLTFTNWDEWVGKWQGARRYAVFLSVSDSFQGEKMGTPRFTRMVGEWITQWVKHLGDHGLKPEELVLLLLDEPNAPEQYEIVKLWAQAINVAQPRVTLYEDPTSSDPTQVDPAVWPELDVICPNLPMFLAGAPSFRDFYTNLQQSGTELWFYSCSGPAKQLDPVTYHRSQFWWNIKLGGVGSFYWAFGDEAGASSWNAYLQKRAQYSPLFLDETSVTDAKHMAGIREGAQDFEYFVMLRNRIAELERKGSKSPLLDQARKLAITGPDRVIATIKAENLGWFEPKDRGVMDEVRVEVLELLDRMANL